MYAKCDTDMKDKHTYMCCMNGVITEQLKMWQCCETSTFYATRIIGCSRTGNTTVTTTILLVIINLWAWKLCNRKTGFMGST